MPATAAAQRDGTLGAGHVLVIRKFLDALPSAVDVGTRAAAEEQLAALATDRRPDALHALAQQLMDWLNPDGNFTDDDRARKRGLTLGKQEPDGMSRISGLLTPELRATLEAVLAWAAPRFPDCGFRAFYAARCEFRYSVRASCGVR